LAIALDSLQYHVGDGVFFFGTCVGSRYASDVERDDTIEALRASEARLRALISVHPDLVFRFSRDGVFLDYHAGERAELLVHGDFVGQNALELLPPALAEMTIRKIIQTLDTGEQQEYDYELELSTGTQIFEARMVASGRDEVVAIVRDVTAQRQAVELRRRFVERVLFAQEEERRRIARELHDEIGQVLTSISLRLAALENAATLEVAQQYARDLRAITVPVAKDVSRLARGLHPQILDDLGFEAAVERLVAESRVEHGKRVDLQFLGNGFETLPKTHSIAAYRILQEALTNVAKHAEAHEVSVVIRLEEQMLHMLVEDDGVGFDPACVEASVDAGLGLYAVRERTSLLDGSVDVESEPGHGTRIAVRLPIR